MNQSASKKELFETMPVGRALFSMALPTIISQIIGLIYNMADTFFIGRTGNSNMMAGIAACLTLVMLMLTFTNLCGIGAGNVVARLNGRGEFDRARRVCSFGVYLAIFIALLYAAIIWIFMNPLLYWQGASDATIGYARSYCIIVVVIGALPYIFSTVLAHLLRNVGFSKQASVGLSGGALLNIALDPLFMFVILPEGYEVIGAAVATVLSNVIAAIYLLITFIRVSREATLSANPKRLKDMTGDDIKMVFGAGIPSALLVGLYDVGNMFLYSIIGTYGDVAVAAIGIVSKVERIPNSLGIGLAQGMLPLIAYNYGNKNFTRLKKIINAGRIYGVIMTLCCVALYQVIAAPICTFFMSTNGANAAAAAETAALAAVFLRLRAVGSPFMYMNYHSSYCLQALGGTIDTIIHVVLRVFAFYIPAMFLLNYLWGANGTCLGLAAGELFGGILAIILLQRRLKMVDKKFKMQAE